jgi:hypothetical protein
MSNKVKKQASSLPFSISRWFRKISTMQPSSFAITVAVMGVAVLLFSGITYDIVNQPLPSYYTGSRFYFLYPSLGEQFLFDTVAAVILYVAGLVGLLALHRSSRHAYNPRQAYMTMVIGITLVFVSYLFLEYFIYAKQYGL